MQNFENDGIQDTIFEVNEFDNSMFFLEFDSIIVEHDLHSWGPDADSYLSYFYGLDTEREGIELNLIKHSKSTWCNALFF